LFLVKLERRLLKLQFLLKVAAVRKFRLRVSQKGPHQLKKHHLKVLQLWSNKRKDRRNKARVQTLQICPPKLRPQLTLPTPQKKKVPLE
jgi:type II secretory pathway predicted ATPase ExeA